jgi:ParB-like chromosome segregation protein Spo0J
MSENINVALQGLVKSIAELKPDSKNARSYEQRSIEAIQKSLLEFGQQKPIVILKDGTVIAGNGTLQAASSLGWKHLACVTFDDVEKARASRTIERRS